MIDSKSYSSKIISLNRPMGLDTFGIPARSARLLDKKEGE